MENTLAFIVPDNRKLVAGIFDPSLIKHRHLLTEIWAVAFVAKACLSPKPYSRPQMADILAALEYIKSAKFTIYGNLQPTGHLGCPALAIAKILDGPEILGCFLGVINDLEFEMTNQNSESFLQEGHHGQLPI
ncbi:hypothetical protein ACH5RR_034117 [Cinchona calisaya]|uniref:Uncharacterized protein n=1 Tax=Cinchona calisaya TaxID=153742 RepID=A0ABD2Y9Y8_9GENT